MSVLDDRPAPSATARAGVRPAPQGEVPGATRFVAVRAHLLPDEIVSGRRTDAMRRRVLAGLVALVAVLALLYGFSWWQTQSAHDDLAGAEQQRSSLLTDTGKYGPLVRAKATTATIEQQLCHLMVGDLPWRSMLTTLRAQAPAGVGLTQVSGSLAAAGSSGDDTGQGVLNRSGSTVVGPMTITGSARDKSAVAAYADKLAAVKGLAAPLVTNVATAEGRTAFTLTVLITTDALGGRYTTQAAGAQTCPKGN